MTNSQPKFHFPSEIELKRNSLVEAWLEIRWELVTDPNNPQIARDPYLDLALGVFYNSVRSKYADYKPLDAARLPAEMIPHVVRFQFLSNNEGSPLLQLGPGVASLNFTSSYKWDHFRVEAKFLLEKLREAYGSHLSINALYLRYRNKVTFNYSSSNLLEFLREKLNFQITPPQYIPGDVGTTISPQNMNLGFSYNLKRPHGTGSIKFVTALDTNSDGITSEVIIFDLEVASTGEFVSKFESDADYETWLDSAHLVTHDWYFSLIDGALRNELDRQ